MRTEHESFVGEKHEPLPKQPRPVVFGGVKYNPDGDLHSISILNGHLVTHDAPSESHDVVSLIKQKAPDWKVVAVGIHGANGQGAALRDNLWDFHDTVSVDVDHLPNPDHETITRHAAERFDGLVAKVDLDPVTREVHPRRLVSKEAYQQDDPERYAQLEHFAKKFEGKRIFHLSSTPQGGGVALMRQAEIDLLNQMGVDAHWSIMKIDAEFTDVTKRSFHNNFQDVEGAKPLTAERKAKFEGVSEENFNGVTNDPEEKFVGFKDQLLASDVVVIDDYQPSGMIPLLRTALDELNKERAAKGEEPKEIEILYRSHIQIDTEKTDKPGTPQYEAWNYLWENNIQYADAFISHPMREFVPKNVPMERVVQMGAATDIGKTRGFDGLNKHLNEEQMDYYLDVVDTFLDEQGGQTPLDRNRPWVAQIARFDPSKNIEGVIEEYKIARDRMQAEGRTDLPQLVIAGHGAVDDPDGKPLFEKTMALLQSDEYKHLASDVKVVRLPHIDQPLNALVQGASVILQRSLKEGFEIKATEAFKKRKPVIGSTEGGIPKQFTPNESGGYYGGYLVSPYDHVTAAGHLYDLLTNDVLRAEKSSEAEAYANADFGTVQNTLNWMYLATRVVEEGRIEDGHFGSVVELAKGKYQQETKDILPIQNNTPVVVYQTT